MSKKGYLIEQGESCHYSYKASTTNDRYIDRVRLFYSNIGNWTEKYKRKLFVKAIADENFNTTITFDDGKVVNLNVSQLNAVYQIARIINKEGKSPFNIYKIIKK